MSQEILIVKSKFPDKVNMAMMDVQNSKPQILLGLNKVGCNGIKKRIIRNGNTIYATIDAFVDLAHDKKGIHMSRIIENIDEAIDRHFRKRPDQKLVVSNCEDFCVEIAKNILKAQNGAERAEVNLTADFVTQRKKLQCSETVEKMYKLIAGSVATLQKEGMEIRKKIGCKAIGLSACPCAQETIKRRSAEKLKASFDQQQIDKILSTMPLVTHNQRVEITLLVETNENEHVELEDLIDISENSFSSEIFEMLKRPEEASVVENAHSNPLFVEDSVREITKNFYKKYGNLKDGIITARVKSFESIHTHDAFAECKISTDDLRKIFG